MLIQLDASRHDWLEGRGPILSLLGAIDDARGSIAPSLFTVLTLLLEVALAQESVLHSGWEGSVLLLELNRPQARNALSFELLEQLSDALRTEGEKARAVVLTGAGGRAFSAGFDMKELTGRAGDMAADTAIGNAVDAITHCRAPVIAAIDGYCHGAGVELAVACDVRVASRTLNLALRAVSLGVVYRFELLSRLALLCGLGRAEHLMLTMPSLDAATALEWGLVGEVVEPGATVARALVLARALEASPRSAVAGTKASFVMIAEMARTQAALEHADALRREAATSPEREETLARALERLGSRGAGGGQSPKKA
jgi:enoyl-CoA hydratase/carnithine racemase